MPILAGLFLICHFPSFYKKFLVPIIPILLENVNPYFGTWARKNMWTIGFFAMLVTFFVIFLSFFFLHFFWLLGFCDFNFNFSLWALNIFSQFNWLLVHSGSHQQVDLGNDTLHWRPMNRLMVTSGQDQYSLDFSSQMITLRLSLEFALPISVSIIFNKMIVCIREK